MENQSLKYSVGEFIALTNQTLEFAYPSVAIEGEVASFKVSQGKFVFFDLKDSEGSVGCFMMVFALRVPIEDGMRVIISAAPKLTQWGKFSLTVRSIRPVGEGSLKKSFELLKKKLEAEGLFAPERKRPLPALPTNIAVISSTGAAGYADFMKLLNDRWGGLSVQVANVRVQGERSPDQIIAALRHFNGLETLPEVIILIRGGGSADDLAGFNDEKLVRAIAESRTPVLTGIGHETDEHLADLAADRAAVTPSNAAQLLLPDKREIQSSVQYQLQGMFAVLDRTIAEHRQLAGDTAQEAEYALQDKLDLADEQLTGLRRLIRQFDPNVVLAKGYGIVRGDVAIGQSIEIEQLTQRIVAEVTHVNKK